mmetsp:Transcript_3077/g.8342  ORF Transcript_3077/g.8342 Transcript_3077/m.8342 type:complete len:313 (+) Transcript_3077:459-1397(+)
MHAAAGEAPSPHRARFFSFPFRERRAKTQGCFRGGGGGVEVAFLMRNDRWRTVACAENRCVPSNSEGVRSLASFLPDFSRPSACLLGRDAGGNGIRVGLRQDVRGCRRLRFGAVPTRRLVDDRELHGRPRDPALPAAVGEGPDVPFVDREAREGQDVFEPPPGLGLLRSVGRQRVHDGVSVGVDLEAEEVAVLPALGHPRGVPLVLGRGSLLLLLAVEELEQFRAGCDDRPGVVEGDFADDDGGLDLPLRFFLLVFDREVVHARFERDGGLAAYRQLRQQRPDGFFGSGRPQRRLELAVARQATHAHPVISE